MKHLSVVSRGRVEEIAAVEPTAWSVRTSVTRRDPGGVRVDVVAAVSVGGARASVEVRGTDPPAVGDLVAAVGIAGRRDHAARRPPPAPGRYDVLLLSGTAGVFFHEVLGHLIESRNTGSVLANRLGTEVLSVPLTVVDDPGDQRMWASSDHDDAGHRADRRTLVNNGRLERFLAPEAQGRLRRDCWQSPLVVRMSNLIIEPAAHLGGDPAQSSERPLLVVEDVTGGSTTVSTGRFTISVPWARLASTGEVVGQFKITGDAVGALGAVGWAGGLTVARNGICRREGQRLPVGVAAPDVRFDNMMVRSA